MIYVARPISNGSRFTASLTGLPVLLREEDIRTEYPEDVDDENVTETGFLPTLPGESTRLSSAIALFAASRILNTALHDLYPSEMEYDVYVSKLRSVATQLDAWAQNLPPHLRLEFSQDKPSMNVTSSRSPLLVSGLSTINTSIASEPCLIESLVSGILLHPVVDSSSCCLLW